MSNSLLSLISISTHPNLMIKRSECMRCPYLALCGSPSPPWVSLVYFIGTPSVLCTFFSSQLEEREQ